MSWLFCVLSHKPFLKWEIEKFIQTHKTASVTKIKPSFYLAAGGFEDNLILKYDNYEQDSGYLVLGNGYLSKDTGFGNAEPNDWKRLIDGDISWEDMNGQFVVFKWNTEYIEAWNDSLGMKDLYFSRSQGYVIISSRLDWLTDFLDKKPWNYNAFGAMTLLPNMLLSQSLLKNVFRLGMAGYVKANQSKFQIGNRRQQFVNDDYNQENKYFFNLNRAIGLQIEIDKKIIIPSENNFANRYLLSTLLNKPKKNWALLEPDTYKKDELEHFLQFQNALLIPSEKNPGLDDNKRLLNLWKDYILSTVSSNLPSELNYVQLYANLNKNEYTLFLPELHNLFLQKQDYSISRSLTKAFEENDPESLFKYFALDHSWLREEFYVFLKKGAIQHIQEYLDLMNDQHLNSLTQKQQLTHLLMDGLNHQSDKISWLNQFGKTYSPFLISELIKERLSLDLKNSELFKVYHTQLENNYPELLFHLKYKEEKIDLRNAYSLDNRLFEIFKDDITETLTSRDVKKSPYYNHKKLDKIVSKLNSDNKKIKRTALKCYAFELWRQHLEKG